MPRLALDNAIWDIYIVAKSSPKRTHLVARYSVAHLLLSVHKTPFRIWYSNRALGEI